MLLLLVNTAHYVVSAVNQTEADFGATYGMFTVWPNKFDGTQTWNVLKSVLACRYVVCYVWVFNLHNAVNFQECVVPTSVEYQSQKIQRPTSVTVVTFLQIVTCSEMITVSFWTCLCSHVTVFTFTLPYSRIGDTPYSRVTYSLA